MKKLIIISILLIFLSCHFVFADEEIDKLIEDYYSAEQLKDLDLLLSYYNMDYITRVIADEETFRTYISAAYEVYEPLTSQVKNIAIDQSTTGNLALVKYDIEGTFKLIDSDEIIPISKTYGAYLEKTDMGWRINFIMDYDLMLLKLEAGSLYSLNLLTEDFAEEDLLIYETTLLNGQNTNDVEEAIASLEAFNHATQVAVDQAFVEKEEANSQEVAVNQDIIDTTNEDESTSDETNIDYEELIQDYQDHEKTKGLLFWIIPILLLVGGGLVYFKILKR